MHVQYLSVSVGWEPRHSVSVAGFSASGSHVKAAGEEWAGAAVQVGEGFFSKYMRLAAHLGSCETKCLDISLDGR